MSKVPKFMIKLPETFTKDGFIYNQVCRDGQIAIFKQSRPGIQANTHYEVGRIRQNAARIQFGTEIPARESWPSGEEWGIRAWTYGDLRRAKERMATLTPPKAANP